MAEAAQAEAKAKEVVEVVGALAAAKQVRSRATGGGNWGGNLLHALPWATACCMNLAAVQQQTGGGNDLGCLHTATPAAGGGKRQSGGERPGTDTGSSCPGQRGGLQSAGSNCSAWAVYVLPSP